MRLYPPGTRKGNKFFIVRKYIGGKQYEITTDATNERAARVFAREFERRVKAQPQAPAAGEKTFRGAAEALAAARNLRPKERVKLERLVAEIGDLPLQSVVAADLMNAAHKLYPGCTNATKNREAITPGANVLHFGAENRWCQYQRIRKLKEPQPEPRRISDADMEALIAGATGALRKLLVFLYLQGWRISEALALRRENVDFDAGTLALVTGKSRRWKKVPMHPEVAAALKAGEWYGDKAFPWSIPQSVYYHTLKLAKRLGIRFTPHMARHAFGGGLRETGATPRDLVDVGTWTSEKSTGRYQHAGAEHAQKVIRRRNLQGERPGETS